MYELWFVFLLLPKSKLINWFVLFSVIVVLVGMTTVRRSVQSYAPVVHCYVDEWLIVVGYVRPMFSGLNESRVRLNVIISIIGHDVEDCSFLKRFLCRITYDLWSCVDSLVLSRRRLKILDARCRVDIWEHAKHEGT